MIESSSGPRLRSYRHPEAELSFYLDRFLRGAYSSRELTQPSGLSTTSKEWSVGTGIGVGCEYFIPHLHVGLAVHSDVANLRYVEDSTKSNLIGAQLATGGAVEFDYAVRPLLVVRAYF